MDVLGGLAAQMTGTPLIVSERASAPAYRDGWKDKLRAFVGKRATAIVANSEAGRSYWNGLGYRGLARVIRNGIPVADIAKAPRADLSRWGVPVGNRVIVFAGRYTEQKNVMLMLEAFEQVARKSADVTALLFGDGPLRPEVERRLSASGLADRIRVGGYCDSLWEVMKAADVFVSVSTFEGNPNTVLEAMAAKCPLVVSDIPEHREFLDESGAYFASPTSADGVAAAIGRVLDNREEARARAEAAHRIASGWSVELLAKEYMDLYGEILRNPIRLGRRRYG
jgi:glycosyltransferase involved in cell wall biosynthesis